VEGEVEESVEVGFGAGDEDEFGLAELDEWGGCACFEAIGEA
jgi:hypothetical protein